MPLQYSFLSEEKSTQTNPIAPIDTVVELYNSLYLKIKDNQEKIKDNQEDIGINEGKMEEFIKKNDKELQDIVDDIYMEIYECCKEQILEEVKEMIKKENKELKKMIKKNKLDIELKTPYNI